MDVRGRFREEDDGQATLAPGSEVRRVPRTGFGVRFSGGNEQGIEAAVGPPRKLISSQDPSGSWHALRTRRIKTTASTGVWT